MTTFYAFLFASGFGAMLFPHRAKIHSRRASVVRWAFFALVVVMAFVFGVAILGAMSNPPFPFESASDYLLYGLGAVVGSGLFAVIGAGVGALIGLVAWNSRKGTARKATSATSFTQPSPVPADLQACANCGAQDGTAKSIRVGGTSWSPPLCLACRVQG